MSSLPVSAQGDTDGRFCQVTILHASRQTTSIEYEPAQSACDDWYLAQVKPNGFERAKLNLTRQGFKTFMPVRASTIRTGKRLASVRRPLFPGYIFIQLPKRTSDWRSVNNTYGVARLVALMGGRPTQVAPALMKALIDGTAPDGIWSGPNTLKTGDKVRMISGPFAEVLAEVADVPDKDRIILILNLMGRSIRMQADPGQLEVR